MLMQKDTQNGASVKASGEDEKPYDFGFALSLPDMLLREAAEKVGDEPCGFQDVDGDILARKTLNSCGESIARMDKVFPSVEAIVAGVYWKALESLGTFGLDFAALEAYHAAGDAGEESKEVQA